MFISLPEQNPFSATRVRPGAVPFQFAAGQTAAALADRLRQHAWRGQIIGPHGSGKSALLATLLPAIERAGFSGGQGLSGGQGRRTRLIELHDGQRRLPIDLGKSPELDSSMVLIVDGYEQLGRFSRFRLKRFCRRRGPGLLVTAHAPVGLPDLFHTAVDLPLAQRIVERLGRGLPRRVTAEDVAERFSRHGGNLRELLFDLYDLYEQRRREA